MEIVDMKSTIIAVPFKPRRVFQSIVGAPDMEDTTVPIAVVTLVEIDTDDGVTGVGEAPSVVGAEVTKKIIDTARPLIIGDDPFNVEKITRKLYGRFALVHTHQHAGSYALNGIEMALWDAIGKSCKRSISEMWGGIFRSKIPFFGLVHRGKPNAMLAEAKQLLDEGFKTLYAKVGIDPELDVECVKTMREAAEGYDNIQIRVDANQAWTPGTAIRIIKRMEHYLGDSFEMVEQPTLMYNLEALAHVRRRVDTPILAHESAWTTYDALNVIKKDAADAIQIDPRFDGGLIGARTIAGMAEAAGMGVVMHAYVELGVAVSALLHVIASCPNFIFANQPGYYQISDDVIEGPMLSFKDGCLELPKGPGLGIMLDPVKVKKYAKYYETNIRGKPLQRIVEAPRVGLGAKPREQDLDWISMAAMT